MSRSVEFSNMPENNDGKLLSEHEIFRFDRTEGNFETVRDVIAVEDTINLYVNDEFYTVFRCVPSKIRELVIGHLLTEGVISDVKDILEIKISGNNIYAKISGNKSSKALTEAGEREILPRIPRGAQKLGLNRAKFNVEVVFRAIEILNSRASIFKASGGTHAAALISEQGDLLAFAEDIGRHNAINKVVGEAAAKGMDFSGMLLASTGRLSSEIVFKAVQVGIPVLVSLSAPTDKGVKIAEDFNLTLIGFARDNRFNIYSSLHRIER